jgi:hypothetical protein
MRTPELRTSNRTWCNKKIRRVNGFWQTPCEVFMDSWNNGRSGNAVLVDSPWTPFGVHGNVWVSVKSSKFTTKLISHGKLLMSNGFTTLCQTGPFSGIKPCWKKRTLINWDCLSKQLVLVTWIFKVYHSCFHPVKMTNNITNSYHI